MVVVWVVRIAILSAVMCFWLVITFILVVLLVTILVMVSRLVFVKEIEKERQGRKGFV